MIARIATVRAICVKNATMTQIAHSPAHYSMISCHHIGQYDLYIMKSTAEVITSIIYHHTIALSNRIKSVRFMAWAGYPAGDIYRVQEPCRFLESARGILENCKFAECKGIFGNCLLTNKIIGV